MKREVYGCPSRQESRGGQHGVANFTASATNEAPRNFMAEYGERLVDQGYHVLPLMPSAKKPGMYLAKRWRNLSDWMRYSTRIPTELEMRYWQEWPGTGVGVLCGRVVAVDIDILKAEIAEPLRQQAFVTLGETGVLRIGQAPKQLLVYRAEEPIQPIKAHPLEILGYGNQFAAYGIHPATGQLYAYPFEDLVDVHFEDLPLVDEGKLRAFLAKAGAAVPPELRKKKLAPDLSRERFYSADGDLRGTREAIEDAMSYIKNDNLDYDSWIYIGMALKAALDGDGEDLWLAFSQQSPQCDKKVDSRETWRSLKPDRIGAGTIYHLAGLNGWKPPLGMFLNPAQKEAVEAVDLSAFFENLQKKRAARHG
jgi:hypothetical protein